MSGPPINDPKGLRKFGVLMFFPLSLIGALLLYRGRIVLGCCIGGAGVALLVLGLLAPRALGPVYRGWMGFARVLGAVNAFVLLTILFFLLITPMAIFFRLLGKDPLHRKIDPEATSYWRQRRPLGNALETYERQF